MLGVNLDELGGAVATLAVTPPGKDRLPWDLSKCPKGAGPRHKHDGRRGCRCQERPLREWCDTLTYRWQLLRQAARIATKRELGHAPPWLLCRVWEPQKRGPAHIHLVMPYETFAEKRAAGVFRKHLARLSHEYDFGHVQGKLQPITGGDAARYLASYLTGRSAKKSSIRENIADANMPRSLLWLTPKLTRRTLVTMRTLRRARHLWAAADGRCPVPRWQGLEEAVRVVTVFRTIYPKRAGPTGNRASALAWAQQVGDYVDAHAPEVVYDGREWVRNEDWDRELTRVAFQATRPSDDSWRGSGQGQGMAA